MKTPARRSWVLLILVSLALTKAVWAQHREHDPRALATNPLDAGVQIAPVLEGLGDNHFAVTTSSERAQLFFDQGLKLTYAFNHQEALRAFKEAVRLDPEAAMAYWGWALVLGPNINLPMQPDAAAQAYEAVRNAVRLKGKVTDKERDLIEALTLRYREEYHEDRAREDQAYAAAMKELHERYPKDNDVATLYAAAIMNLTPWDYWTRDGAPKARTRELLSVLEGALARDPHHEGALHYYIHAVEPVDPARGEEAADLLRGLAPGAGHLVHMPSHVYMQVGRYAEAFDANVNAVAADEGYMTSCRSQGIYPLNYYPHNIHFLAWAAMLQGRAEVALDASRKVAARVPRDHHGNDWALYQTFLSMPLYTMVRFGMWGEILAEPKPDDPARYWTGIWHYARAMALLHTGRLEPAEAELSRMTRLADDPETEAVLIGYSNASTLLQIARHVVAGELAAKKKSYDEAVGHLDRAVRLEDSLLYSEPPDWYYPVRHTLGAVLLEAGRPVEAEVVYWQDLAAYRDNGFALFGLAEALREQGRDEEAEQVEARLKTAWKDADAPLRSSRY